MKKRFENGMRLAPVLLFFGAMSAQEQKQEPADMITDRPDATESSSVVPKGSLQVETGGFYSSFNEANVKTENFVYNTTLLRYGLLDNLEMRLGWDFEERITSVVDIEGVSSLNGMSPLLFGMKLQISEEKEGWPEMAFLGHLYLPFSASTDFKPETTGADFRFSLVHTLSENSSIGYNIGAAWGDDSAEMGYIYSVSYGLTLSDNVGFYAELYGNLPENSKSNHFWNTGFTYLLKPTIQFDATVGTSITKGQDMLLSAGLSFRIPN